MSIRTLVATLLGYVLLASQAIAAEYAVTAGKGVAFYQLDFPTDVPAVPNSSVGFIEANLISLRVNSGIPTGYVNVVRNGEWVVRNMIVPREHDYPYSHLATEFNLKVTAGTDVASMTAIVIYADTAAQTAPTGISATFAVSSQTTNQRGVGDATGGRGAGATDPPDLTNILFGSSAALTRAIFQLDHPNVEAALNQCYPMAIANSLQFLANTTDLKLPHSHIPGLKGDTSLVGQLDAAMNRTATSRTSGSGVDDIPGVNGKLKYLVQNGLQDKVQTRHWGRFSGSTGGSFSEGGKSVTSTAGGTSIPFDEIVSALERGEDCEAAYSFPTSATTTGGHAVDIVGAGYTNGQPWIIESSDLNQDSDAEGAGPKGFKFDLLKDTDGNGDYNLNGSTRNLDLLICQKYIPPPDTSTGTGLPLPGASYTDLIADVKITKTTDPAGHSCCANSPPSTVSLNVTGAGLTITGGASWLPINTTISGNTFSGANTTSVAGFSGVTNSVSGTISPNDLKATITLGTNGALPSGQPISWDVVITPTKPWPWLPPGKVNTGVKPRLRVNGFRDITTVMAGDPLSFTLSMDPGDKVGTAADWFLTAKQESTGAFFHYSLTAGNWLPGVQPTYQGNLLALPNTSLHTRMVGLPKGQYTFMFGVDSNRNGQIDASLMTSDIVTLVVQ